MDAKEAVIHNIPIELLEEHPENSNAMDVRTLTKVKRHIQQTNRYEPLTVRPHPLRGGRYQVINGHNRLRILRSLNHHTVRCVIWDLDDAQTRLYLATLNRLSGREVPERRAALLSTLLGSYGTEELAMLLPEDKTELEELERLSSIDQETLFAQVRPILDDDSPVLLSFMVNRGDAQDIELVLDFISRSRNLSKGQALGHVARLFLEKEKVGS